MSQASTASMPHFSSDRPINDLQHLAIAFQVDGTSRHAAIIYMDADDDDQAPHALHLAWHHHVSTKDLEKPFAWSVPPLREEKLRVLSRLCRRVSMCYRDKGYRGIAYAFRYVGGRFDENSGEFLCADGIGLTCATFVMAVFETRGCSLLEMDSWPARSKDVEWQEDVIKKLEQHPNRDHNIANHIKALRNEVGCARFRPEEVAAASAAVAVPIHFKEAEARGIEIVAWFSTQVRVTD